MASVLDNPAVRQAALPITVEQYHELGRTGIIPANTELVRGVILGKMIKSPEHSWLVQYLVDWLRSALPTGWHVRQEQPLTLSEPEPDVVVVSVSPADYRQRHPSTAELVIEVAVTSSELDREKAAIYAEANVPEYWLFLPGQDQAEVYSLPNECGYTKQETIEIDGFLSPQAFPQLKLALRTLFEAER
ncbi:MAG: Uma2 family endonuclease [Pirellulales bacterium]